MEKQGRRDPHAFPSMHGPVVFHPSLFHCKAAQASQGEVASVHWCFCRPRAGLALGGHLWCLQPREPWQGDRGKACHVL